MVEAKDYRLNGKYLREGEELLAVGDNAQASEKFWGAAAEIIKAVAAKRGLQLGTHRRIGEFILSLDKDHPKWGLIDAFNAANTLHMNFYEDWHPSELVERSAERARSLVENLRTLL